MSKNEAELLSRARRLEISVLAEIYDEYSTGLYRYAYRQLGSQELAEDCVSETFSRFLHAIHKDKGPHSHLKAYLYRIAHNWITDQYRSNIVEIVPLEAEQLISSGEQPEKAVEKRMEQEFIRSKLMMLTSEQRQVIMLKFIEGWSNLEIATAIQKPVGAVKALQHRGLTALRRILSKEQKDLS